MRSSKNARKHCYLCARPLDGRTNQDHCPPQALLPTKLPQMNIDRWIKHEVHQSCNDWYGQDEEYFKEKMIPFAGGSEAGDAILRAFVKKARGKPKKMGRAKKMLREIEERPSGLYLPGGWAVSRQDGDRITRIVWKIVRGLNLHHHDTILQEDHARVRWCHETPVGQEPSKVFQAMTRHPELETHGRYVGVFEYCFVVKGLGELNYWALCFWNKVIFEVLFHNPWFCRCSGCTADLDEIKKRMGEPSSSPPAAATPS